MYMYTRSSLLKPALVLISHSWASRADNEIGNHVDETQLSETDRLPSNELKNGE